MMVWAGLGVVAAAVLISGLVRVLMLLIESAGDYVGSYPDEAYFVDVVQPTNS